MIRDYKIWEREQHLAFDQTLIAERAYEAGVLAAKNHYEEEAVATMEYYDAILRKTSTKSLDEVPPPPTSVKEREVITKLLAGDYK